MNIGPKAVADLSARELLRKFIDRATYETEADGKMYECCLGCDEIRVGKRNIVHSDDCLIIAATRLIDATGKDFRIVKPRGKSNGHRANPAIL
jgi:hypothetical protein